MGPTKAKARNAFELPLRGPEPDEQPEGLRRGGHMMLDFGSEGRGQGAPIVESAEKFMEMMCTTVADESRTRLANTPMAFISDARTLMMIQSDNTFDFPEPRSSWTLAKTVAWLSAYCEEMKATRFEVGLVCLARPHKVSTDPREWIPVVLGIVDDIELGFHLAYCEVVIPAEGPPTFKPNTPVDLEDVRATFSDILKTDNFAVFGKVRDIMKNSEEVTPAA